MSELRELTPQELHERLDNERTALLRMRLNHAISPLDNTTKLSQTKKNIARILTELRSRDMKSNTNTTTG